jgi:hypothetical protein
MEPLVVCASEIPLEKQDSENLTTKLLDPIENRRMSGDKKTTVI